MILLQLMANLFDPKDPRTWPENYDYKPTATFTNASPEMAARNEAYNRQRTRRGFDTPGEGNVGPAGKKLFDVGVMDPLRSMKRTATGENVRVYANPFSGAGWKQRLGALGEDVLNVASVYPGVRAGATALREMRAGAPLLKLGAKELVAPELYEYGIHTSKYANIPDAIDSSRFLNRGGAGDALPGRSYQWRLSPETGAYNNAEMADRAVTSATGWADRLADRTMMEDDEMLSRITQYLTRAPANKAIPDANLALEGYAKLENPASAIAAPLEILDKIPYNLDREAYNEAIKNMIESRQREIALNNKRLRYQRGLNNYTPPRSAYEFAPGELQP